MSYSSCVERTITADRGDGGLRIDLVLRRHLAGADAATRTQLQAWIAEGRVRINGLIVHRVAARTMAGDVVTVTLPAMAERVVMEAEPLPLQILHEDADLLVLNKPTGIVVHPTYGHQTQTLMNGLLWHARDWPEGDRPSIVGRLDKQTSGLVVVAKRADVHATLQRSMASTGSEKQYLAVVYGRPPEGPLTIDLKLARDPKDRRRVVASSTEGSASRTIVATIAAAEHDGDWVSLVRCRLLTGRMHQIRVHLAASGWPIAGDTKYGRPMAGIERQALHACRVSMPHPSTGLRLTIDAPLPPDIQGIVDTRLGPVSL